MPSKCHSVVDASTMEEAHEKPISAIALIVWSGCAFGQTYTVTAHIKNFL